MNAFLVRLSCFSFDWKLHCVTALNKKVKWPLNGGRKDCTTAMNGGKKWWKKDMETAVLLNSHLLLRSQNICLFSLSNKVHFRSIWMACVLQNLNKLNCTDWKVLNAESLSCSQIQINSEYEMEIDQRPWWSVNGSMMEARKSWSGDDDSRGQTLSCWGKRPTSDPDQRAVSSTN